MLSADRKYHEITSRKYVITTFTSTTGTNMSPATHLADCMYTYYPHTLTSIPHLTSILHTHPNHPNTHIHTTFYTLSSFTIQYVHVKDFSHHKFYYFTLHTSEKIYKKYQKKSRSSFTISVLFILRQCFQCTIR